MTGPGFIGGLIIVMFSAAVVIALISHIFGMIGIGEGGPWTISKKDREAKAAALKKTGDT